MEKIKPKAWLRFARKKPQLIEVSFHKTLPPALKNNGWVQKPLYTREALEAVAEAVKAQCMEDAAAWSMSFVQVDNAPHGIDDELGKYVDTAAIINQLTGE